MGKWGMGVSSRWSVVGSQGAFGGRGGGHEYHSR